MKQPAHSPSASAHPSTHRPFFRRGGEGAFFAKGSTQAKPVDGGQVIQRMPKEDLSLEFSIVPGGIDEETLIELESLTNTWEKAEGAAARSDRVERVKNILQEVTWEAMSSGEKPKDGWVEMIRLRLIVEEGELQRDRIKEEAAYEGRKADNLLDYEADEIVSNIMEDAMDELAERKDVDFPTFFETVLEEEPFYLNTKEAAMGNFEVLYLKDASYSLSTTALNSCTGLAIYDPVSQVGALMHVYVSEDYPKIRGEMIDAMKAEAKANFLETGPVSGFMASLMPGMLVGVNKSHISSILAELEKAGIIHIRNLAEEGRRSSGFRLIGGGKITNK